MLKITKRLRCDMELDCDDDVTYIDEKRYIFCKKHGVARRPWKRARALRPWELRLLNSGKENALDHLPYRPISHQEYLRRSGQ
jgi:hypothetical protein